MGLTQPQHVAAVGIRNEPGPDPVAERPRMLELFSGTGSVAEVYRKQGFEVFTLDADPKAKADFQVDILHWKFHEFPPGHFDTIFAAPPCTEYSQAMTSRKRNMEAADKLVKKTLEAIKHLQPRVWFLENPATGHLKNRGLLDGVDFVVVDYCRFAPWGYRKPTQIWGSGVVGLNNVGRDPKTCPNMTLQPSMDPAGKSTRRHRVKLEGCVVPLREKYRIPQRLVEYLAKWSAPPTM